MRASRRPGHVATGLATRARRRRCSQAGGRRHATSLWRALRLGCTGGSTHAHVSPMLFSPHPVLSALPLCSASLLCSALLPTYLFSLDCSPHPPSLVLFIPSALYSRDNLTDVWNGLDALAEQASYIWFTRELDAQLRPGHVETPPKDPSASFGTPLRHGDSGSGDSGETEGGRRTVRGGGGDGGGGGGTKLVGGGSGGSGGGSGSRRRQKSGKLGGAMSGGLPSLRVVPASSQDVYSKENGK